MGDADGVRSAITTGRFILSINDVPEIRELFGAFELEPVELTYTVAGGKSVRPRRELIITNFDGSNPVAKRQMTLERPQAAEGDGYILVARAGLSMIPIAGPLLEKLAAKHLLDGTERSTRELLDTIPDVISEIQYQLDQLVASGTITVETENGENSNGYYRRLSSGIQEVRHALTLTGPSGENAIRVTFPAQFSTVPVVDIRADKGQLRRGNVDRSGMDLLVTGSSPTIVAYRAIGTFTPIRRPDEA